MNNEEALQRDGKVASFLSFFPSQDIQRSDAEQYLEVGLLLRP